MKKHLDLILIVIAIILAAVSSFIKGIPDVGGVNLFLIVGIACLLISLIIKLSSKNYLELNKNSKFVLVYYAVISVVVIGSAIYASTVFGSDMGNLAESKKIALPLTATIMLLVGLMARNIKMNARLGLRMPWLYTSENRWVAAHKCLSDISIPIVVLYVLVSLITPASYFSTISIVAILLWIIIPSIYPVIKRIA